MDRGASAQVAGVAFTADGRGFAVADGLRVVLCPVTRDARRSDPGRLREAAEEAAGLHLQGFALRAPPPRPARH